MSTAFGLSIYRYFQKRQLKHTLVVYEPHSFIACSSVPWSTRPPPNIHPTLGQRLVFVDVWFTCTTCTVVQSQKAVSAYFTSKQILPFSFAEQCSLHVLECICGALCLSYISYRIPFTSVTQTLLYVSIESDERVSKTSESIFFLIFAILPRHTLYTALNLLIKYFYNYTAKPKGSICLLVK